jgi:hypothetical protein
MIGVVSLIKTAYFFSERAVGRSDVDWWPPFFREASRVTTADLSERIT